VFAPNNFWGGCKKVLCNSSYLEYKELFLFLQIRYKKHMSKKICLTGIQPTGNIHLGNYYGALKPHLDFCASEDVLCRVLVADLHSKTGGGVKVKLSEFKKQLMCLGYKEEEIVFQSEISDKILNIFWEMLCKFSIKSFLTNKAYIDKIEKGAIENIGLAVYPLLQAADIAAMEADIVFVGPDQVVHLDVAKDAIARVGRGKIFESVVSNVKVLGRDGNKMSKSLDNQIEIFDDLAKVRKNIFKYVTDSTPVEDPKNYETCSVYSLLSLMLNEVELERVKTSYINGGVSYREYKELALAAFINVFIESRRIYFQL
jgi:tryptophanyl-tRNA synthetase